MIPVLENHRKSALLKITLAHHRLVFQLLLFKIMNLAILWQLVQGIKYCRSQVLLAFVLTVSPVQYGPRNSTDTVVAQIDLNVHGKKFGQLGLGSGPVAFPGYSALYCIVLVREGTR